MHDRRRNRKNYFSYQKEKRDNKSFKKYYSFVA